MVESFTTWAETAAEVTTIDDTTLRENVVNQAEQFIRFGQDKALELKEQ